MNRVFFAAMFLASSLVSVAAVSLVSPGQVERAFLAAVFPSILFLAFGTLTIVKAVGLYRKRRVSKGVMIACIAFIALLPVLALGAFNSEKIKAALLRKSLKNVELGFTVDFPGKFIHTKAELSSMDGIAITGERYSAKAGNAACEMIAFDYPPESLRKYSPLEIMLFYVNDRYPTLDGAGMKMLSIYSEECSGIDFNDSQNGIREGFIYMKGTRCFLWYYEEVTDGFWGSERVAALNFIDSFKFLAGPRWETPGMKDLDTDEFPLYVLLYNDEYRDDPHAIRAAIDEYMKVE